MQVILLEKIRNLGNLGDSVEVKAGYARNFLIPERKAVFATAENLKRFEKQRAGLEKKAKELFDAATKRAEELESVKLVIHAQASDQGKLYGSVGVSEIRDALLEQSQEVSRREIVIQEGRFYEIGEYVVEVHVHSDVVAHVNLSILAS